MGANDRQVLMTVQASGVRSETGSSYKQNPGNSSGGSMSYRSPIISQASAQKKENSNGGVLNGSATHFNLKATNSYRSPESLPKERKKVKKSRFQTKGSLFDDLRVDDKGKLFLPSHGLKSPKKQRPSKKNDLMGFISNTVPHKFVDLFSNAKDS